MHFYLLAISNVTFLKLFLPTLVGICENYRKSNRENVQLEQLNVEVVHMPTIIQKMFETNNSFHLKYCTMKKV